MNRVIVESPFGGQQLRNIIYARAALRDCLLRGEAPYASHLLYTQSGVLDDDIPEERLLGMQAGFHWHGLADYVAVYIDFGISRGMQAGMANAKQCGLPISERRLPSDVLAQVEQTRAMLQAKKSVPF